MNHLCSAKDVCACVCVTGSERGRAGVHILEAGNLEPQCTLGAVVSTWFRNWYEEWVPDVRVLVSRGGLIGTGGGAGGTDICTYTKPDTHTYTKTDRHTHIPISYQYIPISVYSHISIFRCDGDSVRVQFLRD